MNTKVAEQEREKYSRLISDKENILSDLKDEHQKMEGMFRDVHEDLDRGFRELVALNEEALHNGNSDGLANLQQLEEQERVFRQQLEQSEDYLLEDYHVEVRNCNEEIDNLYQKRGELSLD
ncbi:hypothetical protein [uncultured Enterococcus sp.]|uniref:hypothetical protein n=1 Tax=uncultured Enterococcus sp. TaxID=167972 RepID=UPI002AA6C25F|nr:hypothetical protein [uncultured Enterococcus sp.]